MKRRIVDKDDEGNTLESYDSIAKPIKMNVQPAGGKAIAEIYGERMTYMKACKYQGDALVEGVNENDGICLNVGLTEEPDYKVVSIHTYSTHKNVLLERRLGR